MRRPAATPALSILLFTTLAMAGGEHDHSSGKGHADAAEENHAADHHDDAPEGPHGGRLLRSGDFAVEVSIFETGIEPQLRLYLFDHDRPVDPAGATASVDLTRLGREPEHLSFSVVGDFLVGDRVVAEPHSFDVDLEVSWKGQTLTACYETLEARVGLDAATFAVHGLATEVAEPRPLERSRRLSGRVGIPGDRIVDVRPRFPGVLREAVGRVGDTVRKGQAVAVIESDQSLSRYEVPSPLDGVLLERKAVAGAAVAQTDVLFVVADLTEVWADLDVYGTDTSVVRSGEAVTVRDDIRGIEAKAVLSYISPLRDVHTQTMLARAVLANADGRWTPGAFLTATVNIDEAPAAIAVPVSSLQTWRGREAVFVVVGDIQEARPVRIGRRGEQWVEVLEGLRPGDVVATGNTFLLRAEIEKAGASHDH